uniref:H/ACA ribonucleoprotein complex non-core subunit NAF1 n=1 Tax=Cacopsylla melanoneura TaxID=428564 RepID=A0A8D9ADY4_9HEMI
MASNTTDNNNVINTTTIGSNDESLQYKTNNVSAEEQDNINNMNVTNEQQQNTTNAAATNAKFIENNREEANMNNNHVENEVVNSTSVHVVETSSNIANNNTTTTPTQSLTNYLKNIECNGQNNVNVNQNMNETNHVSPEQESSCSEDVSLQNNALSDLMNTYSSDEDMFENFRSKTETIDDHKSDNEECLSSSTSFLSINESGNSSEDEPIACAPKKTKGVKMKSTRNKGELDLDDLPPIEDLQISVPEDQCLPVGKILNIVDTLVLIKTLKNTPTLDLDSVLFLDKGQRTLGKIFDVIGPVSGPVYCVRFNSHQHIVDSNIKIDQDVYCAPQTEHTSYVPLPDLIKTRGSDASWEKDREPPVEVVEFSDDEEERRVKREILRDRKNNRNNNQQHNSSSLGSGRGCVDPDSEPPQPKTPRPTPFEQRMNLRNLLMTASYERRNRITGSETSSSSVPPSTSAPTQPPPPPIQGIIRPPTLPDIPPLPLPHMTQVPRYPPPPLGVFSPPPLFHTGNKKHRPSTASPFSPRYPPPPNSSSPFSPPIPPMFPPAGFPSLPPPPPLFNDVLLFATHPHPHPPNPYGYPSPPPFQFGMPPLLGPRSGGPPPPTRYRHTSNPRPPSMMRPAFGSRHRF